MRFASVVVLLVASLALAGCGPIFHREMLGKAIAEFSSPMKDQNPEKVWITNMADSGCDSHKDLCTKCSGGALGGLGGLSLGGGGGSSFDGLAFEVFANYITQKHKGRVVETHRHNYAMDLKPVTHQPLEVAEEEGGVKKHTSGTTCEDLCLLDEAKKRSADKVLAYAILSMSNEELRIHLRLSDVKTGVVEFSRTLFVQRGVVADISF